ncbi:MAG: hypothetical protein N7Q72_05710, partial [Spiroplasma sp. Tabriz.8]|nr:hypothetical protein [Spiroplasma sp. Tabriz.8]
MMHLFAHWGLICINNIILKLSKNNNNNNNKHCIFMHLNRTRLFSFYARVTYWYTIQPIKYYSFNY